MLTCDYGPSAKEGWPALLRTAVLRFSEQASAGNIRVRGRYVTNYSDDKAAAQANTAYLSETELRDFASFDSLHGGLERGAGLTWQDDAFDSVLDRIINGRGDGWRDVEVCSADLMKCFPAEARTDDPTRALRSSLPETKGGRPNLTNDAIAEHKARIRAGTVIQNKAQEARAIHAILADRNAADPNWELKPESIKRTLSNWRKDGSP